jgi:hypothetical protein
MNRRTFLTSLIITPAAAALLAACGDDRKEATPRNTGDTTPPDTSAPTVDGIAHPTGADDVVLRLGYAGGFTMQGASFTFPPTLLVSGDGRVFQPGAQIEIYPGPLLQPVMVRTITEAGVQKLLRLADDAGLLATPPDYTADIPVADAPDTVVTINADGGSYVHQAYALGMDLDASGQTIDGLTPQRAKLKKFVDLIGDITPIVGAENLGEEAPFEATAYRFQAYVVDPAALVGQEPAPTVVPWPASTGIKLAAAAECARLDAAAAGSVFTDAMQNTYFTDEGVTYSIAVGRVLPGDPDC